MKKHSLTICLFLALFIPSISFAANHHVRSDCAYNGNGTTWACATVSGGTGAYKALPATLVRGDTYYIADGSYASYIVDDAVSGTSVITIKKATIAEHGTETGWDSSYGDGQAVFEPFNINTSYIIFDGVIGSGSDPNAYGFKIPPPTNCDMANRLLKVPAYGFTASNVTISHVAIISCGSSYDYTQIGIYSNPATAGSSNMTLSYNYLANGNSNLLIRGWTNSTISNNYFAGNWSSAANHGTQISPGAGCNDIVLKNNIFKDSQGTAAVSVHKDNNNRWKVFNNLIIGGAMALGFGNGDSSSMDVMKSWEFHHNTFVNVIMGSQGAFFVGNLTNVLADKSYAYNNLFYNTRHPNFNNSGYTSGAIVHTHNTHFNSTGIYDSSEGGTAVNTTGDPFVNSAFGNYHLKIRTKTGKVLSSPYNIDKDGNTRGASVPGIWDIRDRGAYRYSPAGYSPGPSAPYSPGRRTLSPGAGHP